MVVRITMHSNNIYVKRQISIFPRNILTKLRAEYLNQKLENKIQRHFDHSILFFKVRRRNYRFQRKLSSIWSLGFNITILSAATVFGVARMDDDGYDRRKNLQKNYMHNSLIMLVGKTIETCNVEINSWFAVPQAKKFLKKQLKQW